MAYQELEVRLTPGPGDAYNVEVTAASGARGFGHFTPPPSIEVERFRRTADPSSRRMRGAASSEQQARTFGSRLFESLFSDPSTREVYAAARRSAARSGLRVTLSMRATPELVSIPWEYLYDEPRFLALHRDSPVVRFVDLEEPPEPLLVQGPLRILGMVSHPLDDDLANLDAEGEKAALQRRLDPLIRVGRVSLRWMQSATLAELQQEVDYGEEFHVFHYIGHGSYDPDTGASHLVMEHSDRRPHRVNGQQLGTYLGEQSLLRLAVLNACEAASVDPQDPMAGVATALMEYGVPAVVAMQFAISDPGALVFASEFYRGIAQGDGVDTAITRARRALAANTGPFEWGTPVLFLRSPDSHLFSLAQDQHLTAESGKSPRAEDGTSPEEAKALRAEEEAEARRATEEADAQRVTQEAEARRARDEAEARRATEQERVVIAEEQPGAVRSEAPDSTRQSHTGHEPTGRDDHRTRADPRGAVAARELKRLAIGRTVNAVKVSPDDRYVATASDDHTATLWDQRAGTETNRFEQDGPVRSVAFSSDSRFLASGGKDGTARIWDIGGNREFRRFHHPGAVLSVAFSPDGRRLVCGRADKSASVWDVESGTEVARLAHAGAVNAVACSPDGRLVVTGSSDRAVRLWDALTGAEKQRYLERGEVKALSFSADGARFAVGLASRMVHVYRIGEPPLEVRFTQNLPDFLTKADPQVWAVALAPNGLQLAAGGPARATKIFDLVSGDEVTTIAHDTWVNSLTYTADGTHLVCGLGGYRRGYVSMWDLRT